MEGAAIILFFLLFVHKGYAAELHTISASSNFLTDGDTLVSAAGIFELGFFKPGSSENRYLGIWFKNISDSKVVWVANRDHPLPGASPIVLKITDKGILGLFSNNSMIWSSNTTTSGNATAKLQDNGNLVVVDQDIKIIWQSFDYPTDTLLPGMKIGRDYLGNQEWRLSSWKSRQDPAPGEWTWGVDIRGYPQSKLKKGAVVELRSRPWRNQPLKVSSGLGVLTFTYDVIINEDEVSFAYNLENSSIFLQQTTLNSSGHLESWLWVEDGKGWHNLVSMPRGDCDTYNICNAYGTCNTSMMQQSCSLYCKQT